LNIPLDVLEVLNAKDMFFILKYKYKIKNKQLKKYVPKPYWKFVGKKKPKKKHASPLV
jgi:hypothetical protein